MQRRKKIVVSSFGINTGGGLTLLTDLCKSNHFIKKILLDYRLKKNKKFKKIKKVFISKNYFIALIIFIKEIYKCQKNDIFLCYNNIPPLIKPKCKTVLFLQNAFFVSDIKIKLKLSDKLKLYLLKSIFYFCLSNVNIIYVQNLFLKKKIIQILKKKKLTNIKVYKLILLTKKLKNRIINKKKSFQV